MSRLLSLPRELRDIIISHVLSSQQHPPVDNSEPVTPRIELVDIKYKSWRGPQSVMFEAKLQKSATHGLLLANRQLQAETKDALRELPGKGGRYALDVMFVEEKELWPTWLHVPVFTTDIDRLDVSIRVVGAMKVYGAGYHPQTTIWKIGDGAPPAVVWPFYTLLERVLRIGPTRIGNATSAQNINIGKKIALPYTDYHITIKNLTLTFPIPPDDTEELAAPIDKLPWLSARTRRFTNNLEGLRSKVMRPEWLADYLLDFLRRLLSMGYHMAEYGTILYERVGSITVRVGDEAIAEIDLGEMLANVEFNNSFGAVPREGREEHFEKWKREAREMRLARGLPVRVLPLTATK